MLICQRNERELWRFSLKDKACAGVRTQRGLGEQAGEDSSRGNGLESLLGSNGGIDDPSIIGARILITAYVVAVKESKEAAV